MRMKKRKQLAEFLSHTPFIEQKKDMDQSTLKSIKVLFELLHVDIGNIRFFSKSAVDPRYFLLAVDLFT